MQKQKKNSREGITWSEMGKQNVQAEKVYWSCLKEIWIENALSGVDLPFLSFLLLCLKALAIKSFGVRQSEISVPNDREKVNRDTQMKRLLFCIGVTRCPLVAT